MVLGVRDSVSYGVKKYLPHFQLVYYLFIFTASTKYSIFSREKELISPFTSFQNLTIVAYYDQFMPVFASPRLTPSINTSATIIRTGDTIMIAL